ncbi:MAG: Asp23/Gls24 family envelope stress response protein [Clostridiales bacterium]|nr:Asp23/Gls24 family envelope stress response protein [Clostridiales bacterium]
MEVYGFVGTSGTGKSYHAGWVANSRGISCIIDDGVLIKGTRILAGISAKKENTKLAAVRRALFMESAHAEQVINAIRAENPSSILILGTSVPMIEKIVQRLQLPPVKEIIRIEDIASHREIRLARRQRTEQGKHIIPVPTFEVRKDFSGFFIDPLRIFRVLGREKRIVTMEKTVVRPTYSYFGKFFIADSAIESIAIYCAQNISGVYKVQNCQVYSREEGITIEMDVTVIYGYPIHRILREVQEQVAEEVGYATSLNILAVNVTARRVMLLKDEQSEDGGRIYV